MPPTPLSPRLRALPRRRACGLLVPVAVDFRARLLGLAGLRREQAGPGLLIPDCGSVHTCGMRFELDLVFLDARGRPLQVRHRVPPRRLAWHRDAVAILEVPAAEGGEFAPPQT